MASRVITTVIEKKLEWDGAYCGARCDFRREPEFMSQPGSCLHYGNVALLRDKQDPLCCFRCKSCLVENTSDEVVHITRADLLSRIAQIEQKTGYKVLTNEERVSVQPPHGAYDPPGIDSDHERFMATHPAPVAEVERLANLVASVLLDREKRYPGGPYRAVARAILSARFLDCGKPDEGYGRQ